MVVDRSPSQNLENRAADADATIAKLRETTQKFEDLELRVVETNGGSDHAEKGTQLFDTVREALADIPQKRLAGLVLVTDGQVHDVPAAARELGITAPVHLALTGDPNGKDRRIVVTQSPTFGLVGKSVDVTFQVDDLGSPAQGVAKVTIRRDGEQIADIDAVDRPAAERAARHRAWRPDRVRDRGAEVRPGADARQQRGGVRGQRRARPPEGAADLRRAVSGRAHLAQPAEVRSVGRADPLHHPAAAEQAGRDADQRAGADRLPGRRAVRYQAARIRPDHLRSVPAPWHPAGRVFPAHRRVCEGRRRGVRIGGAELRRPVQPLSHAAGADLRGPADRRDPHPGLPAAGDAGGPAPSGDRRPAAAGPGQAELGPLVPRDAGQLVARRHGDERRRRLAAADPRPRRQGPRGAAVLRPAVDVVQGLRRRRPACRADPAHRPLADAGAGPRGRGSARHRDRRPPGDPPPEPHHQERGSHGHARPTAPPRR